MSDLIRQKLKLAMSWLLDEMPRVKTIIDSADKEELNKYCDSHDGFYRYMKILENTASASASGSIKVPR